MPDFTGILGKKMHESLVEKAEGTDEGRLRARLLAALHTTFDPIIGASLATAPRQMRTSFEVALALGIDIVKEPRLLWLADLAQSLPTPIGWGVAEHPELSQPPFWHNELTLTSQWQHPTDEFVKTLATAIRGPLQPRSKGIVRTLLGEQVLSEFIRPDTP